MAGVDITYLAAGGAGLISFLSPCVLPLVPAYLCFIAGTSFQALTEHQAVNRQLARRVTLSAFAFVLGFSTVFILLGASASALSQVIAAYSETMGKVAGAVIIVFGLHTMGLFRIGVLNREARIHSAWQPATAFGAYIVGLAFAFGWTPCIGPILATILTLAASRTSLGYGVGLLATYALGLGIPFMLAALAVRPFMTFLGRFRRHLHKVELVTGALLILTGVLMLTDSLSPIGYYLLEWFPALAQIG